MQKTQKRKCQSCYPKAEQLQTIKTLSNNIEKTSVATHMRLASAHGKTKSKPVET